MRCFLMGVFGASLLLFIFFFIKSQYADYQGYVETGELLALVRPAQSIIEQSALRDSSLIGAGENIKVSDMTKFDTLEITDSSVIILRGKKYGQVIVLIPKLEGNKVTWVCIGGPSHAMPVSKLWGQALHLTF